MQTPHLAPDIPGFCGLHLPNETKDVNKPEVSWQSSKAIFRGYRISVELLQHRLSSLGHENGLLWTQL